MKKERLQIAGKLKGNYVSSIHWPQESWLHLESRLMSRLFENKGIIFITIYILLLLCTIGCIQDKYIEGQSRQEYALNEPASSDHSVAKDNGGQDSSSGQDHNVVPGNSTAQENIIDPDPNLLLELDFQSGVGNHLFRSWGILILWSNRSLPYLVLNATLCNEDHQVDKAKCMLMQIEPGKKYSFDISKNLRIPKGDYSCILEALGPFGLITSEKRDCSALNEITDSIFLDEIGPVDKKASNDDLDQYRIKVIAEKGASQDKYANQDKYAKNEKASESILRTSSEDIAQESNRDAEKSYGSEPGYNSKAGGQESQDSIPQGVSSSRSSEGSVMGVNRKDSDNQTIAVKGNTQIADQDDNEIFVGSTGSNKYHLSDCRFVAKIKNKIFYKSSEEAKKDGKVPCKICNPR